MHVLRFRTSLCTTQLTAIGTRGDALVIEYAYACNNVAIAQSGPAIRLTVREHRIVEVSLSVCCYRAGESTTRMGGQQWMLNLAEYLQQKEGRDGRILLRYAIEDDPASLRADWVLDDYN